MLYEELGDKGFVPITVALDHRAEDVRPFIEEVAPTHPSLIDSEHVVAERYHIVNVPTIVWVDEAGRVVRPNDAQFGTDTFTSFHGKRSEPYLEMIRAWVLTGAGALSPGDARKLSLKPTVESELSRVEQALAWYLSQSGQVDAAERHFSRACELAPLDWTIRRGSMPVRGQNPFGPEFFALAEEGAPSYPMDDVTPTQEPA
jgi:hypothetical protein